MAASLVDYADAILKNVVLPTIIKLDRTNTVFSARLKRSAVGIKGGKVISDTMIRGEQGFGTRARASLTYPTASKGKFLQAESALKFNYGTMELEGPDRILSENAKSEEAVASILTVKGASFGENFATDNNRQYWGDGTGTLAKVAVAENGVTIIQVDDAKYFDEGMIIDIHESSVIENRTVDAVNDEDNTITISGAVVNVTVGTVITRADSKDNEIVGVPIMVGNTGDYLNISRDTYKKWASIVMNGNSEPFALETLDEMIIKQIHRKKGKPSIMYIDADTLLWIIYLLDKKKGIRMDVRKIELGYEAPVYIAPEVGAVPLVVESHSPKGIFSLDERFLSLRRPKEPWFEPGTSGYWHADKDSDKDYAHIKYYFDLYNTDPSKSAKYTNYVSPVT